MFVNTHECTRDMYSTLPHGGKLFTVCYSVLWFGVSKCDQQVTVICCMFCEGSQSRYILRCTCGMYV